MTTTQDFDVLREATERTLMQSLTACRVHRATVACLDTLDAAPAPLSAISLDRVFDSDGAFRPGHFYAEPSLVNPGDPDGDQVCLSDGDLEDGQANPLGALWDAACHDLLSLWSWVGGDGEADDGVVLDRGGLEEVRAATERIIRRVGDPLVPSVEDLDFDLSPYDASPEKPHGLSLSIHFDDGVAVTGWRRDERGLEVPLGTFRADNEWAPSPNGSGDSWTDEEREFLEWAAEVADGVVYGWSVDAFGGDAMSRLARLLEGEG